MTGAKRDQAAMDGNLHMIVGQVMEAARATAEGIKVLTQEVREHGETLISAVKTVESIDKIVAELDGLVRTDADGLAQRVRDGGKLIAELQEKTKNLGDLVSTLAARVGKIDRTHAKASGVGNAIFYGSIAVAWLITTAVAVIALVRTNS